jgi:hypothetical protein
MKESLIARDAINGDVMIFGHNEIDIVIMKEEKKIVAFAKDLMTESVYGAESRLFEFLKRRGVIAFDSIRGGNVYGSLEAQIHDASKTQKNYLFETLLALVDFMKDEKPYIESSTAFDDMVDEYYTSPDDHDTTELGEIPHEQEKGSILQRNLFAPYLYGRYTY